MYIKYHSNILNLELEWVAGFLFGPELGGCIITSSISKVFLTTSNLLSKSVCLVLYLSLSV